MSTFGTKMREFPKRIEVLSHPLLVLMFIVLLIEIKWVDHSISYKIASASSKNSDHPAHPRSLISLCCPPDDALDPWLPTECPAKTQIERRRRLIRINLRWTHMYAIL